MSNRSTGFAVSGLMLHADLAPVMATSCETIVNGPFDLRGHAGLASP